MFISETIKYEENIKFEYSYGVKSNIAVKNTNHNCGAKILKKYISQYDAEVISILRKNNYFPTFILNCDEFAIGGRGFNSWLGDGENIFDKNQIVGGSSFGSALSVSKKLVPFSLGSTTGGSVRIPAHFNKIYAFEPSQGAISRMGLTLHSSSMDKIGILSNEISILQNIFLILTSEKSEFDLQNKYFNFQNKEIKKIGIVNNLEFEYESEYFENISNIKDEIVDISEDMKFLNQIYKDYYFISGTEAYFNLGRFNGSRFLKQYRSELGNNFLIKYKEIYNDLSLNTRERLEMGKYFLSDIELQKKIFDSIKNFRTQINKIFEKVDAIFLPTCPFKQFFKEQKDKNLIDKIDQYTSFTNIFGGCAISIPVESSQKEFKSFQFISSVGNDKNLLKYCLEWKKKK